ncbi:MAG: hypothetical protein MH321_12140 [Leptospiraceae bacterium]|nr:hypothetical protein [Leptospiraceae bacterium]
MTNASYSYANGFGASVGVSLEKALGVKGATFGLNYNEKTGFGASLGYDIGGGFNVGVGVSGIGHKSGTYGNMNIGYTTGKQGDVTRLDLGLNYDYRDNSYGASASILQDHSGYNDSSFNRFDTTLNWNSQNGFSNNINYTLSQSAADGITGLWNGFTNAMGNNWNNVLGGFGWNMGRKKVNPPSLTNPDLVDSFSQNPMLGNSGLDPYLLLAGVGGSPSEETVSNRQMVDDGFGDPDFKISQLSNELKETFDSLPEDLQKELLSKNKSYISYDENGNQIINVIDSKSRIKDSLSLDEMLIIAKLKPGEIFFSQYTASVVLGVGASISIQKFIDSDGNVEIRNDNQLSFGIGAGINYTSGIIDGKGKNASEIGFNSSLDFGAFYIGGSLIQTNVGSSIKPSINIGEYFAEIIMPKGAIIGVTATPSLPKYFPAKILVLKNKMSAREKYLIEKLRKSYER